MHEIEYISPIEYTPYYGARFHFYPEKSSAPAALVDTRLIHIYEVRGQGTDRSVINVFRVGFA